MMHARIVDHLAGVIGRYPDRDVRILELGCGDAYVVRQAASRQPIARYVGVDMSDMALHYAREGMARSSSPERSVRRSDEPSEMPRRALRPTRCMCGETKHAHPPSPRSAGPSPWCRGST
jgi:hypothetical protein